MSDYPSYLIHYGIQGQKWGVRRFQNEDGTYTEDGLVRRRQDQKHFVKSQERIGKKFDKVTEKIKRDQAAGKKVSNRRIEKAAKLGTKFRSLDYISKDPNTYLDSRRQKRNAAIKYGINVAASAAAIGLATNSIITNKRISDIENRKVNLDNVKVNGIKVNEIKVNEIKTYENSIKENVIKENVIKENVIKENRISGSWDNVKTYENSSKYFDDGIKGAAKSTALGVLGKYVPPVAIGLSVANIGRSTANFVKENKNINNLVNEYYKDFISKSRSDTIKDLEKHGIKGGHK